MGLYSFLFAILTCLTLETSILSMNHCYLFTYVDLFQGEALIPLFGTHKETYMCLMELPTQIQIIAFHTIVVCWKYTTVLSQWSLFQTILVLWLVRVRQNRGACTILSSLLLYFFIPLLIVVHLQHLLSYLLMMALSFSLPKTWAPTTCTDSPFPLKARPVPCRLAGELLQLSQCLTLWITLPLLLEQEVRRNCFKDLELIRSFIRPSFDWIELLD